MQGPPTSLVTGGSAAKVHGDVSVAGVNPWAAYFGPTNVPMTTNAHERYSAQNYDLPEAYRGKNIYLRDTLNDLITGEGRTAFYTQTLLPWEQTDQISFAWNEFHFNEQLAGRVPHEGVSRLVTSSKRSRHDKSVRRGLAMVLEHGFMGTADGMEMYRRNMIGIAQSVQETANHDVMSAVLSSESYDRQWEAQHGVVKAGIERLVQDEVYRFGAVQKQENGLDLLVEDTKKRMGRYGVQPDTLIIPPKMSVYMAMVRPEKAHYYMGGQIATQSLRAGGNVTTFRNLAVFETRSFDVYNGEPPIDLTLRDRMIGEYYYLSADHDSIEIYNEDSDEWQSYSKETLTEMSQNVHGVGAATDDALAHEHSRSPHYGGTDVDASLGHGTAAFAALVSSQARAYRAASTVQSAPDQRRAVRVAEALRARGWGVHDDGGHMLCEHGQPCYSLVGTRSLTLANVPPQFEKVTVREGTHHHSRPRLTVDEVVVRSIRRGSTQFSFAPTAAGGALTRMCNAAAKADAARILGPLTDDQSLRSDFAALYALSSQTPEFQQCFSGSSTMTDERVDAASDGWTGHCGLHMSYPGLKLIAAHGTPAQIEAAGRWIDVVDGVYQSGLVARPAVMLLVAESVPHHYMAAMSQLAGRAVKVSQEDIAKAWIFSTVTNSRYGHSLMPVGSDGVVSSQHRGLRGDTILCPSYSIQRFCAEPTGVVGGLALVNEPIGLSGVTAPSQVPEVNGSRWQLGVAAHGTPLPPLAPTRRAQAAEARAQRRPRRRPGRLGQDSPARNRRGVLGRRQRHGGAGPRRGESGGRQHLHAGQHARRHQNPRTT
jgi:hypothetical protein